MLMHHLDIKYIYQLMGLNNILNHKFKLIKGQNMLKLLNHKVNIYLLIIFLNNNYLSNLLMKDY